MENKQKLYAHACWLNMGKSHEAMLWRLILKVNWWVEWANFKIIVGYSFYFSALFLTETLKDVYALSTWEVNFESKN